MKRLIVLMILSFVVIVVGSALFFGVPSLRLIGLGIMTIGFVNFAFVSIIYNRRWERGMLAFLRKTTPTQLTTSEARAAQEGHVAYLSDKRLSHGQN